MSGYSTPRKAGAAEADSAAATAAMDHLLFIALSIVYRRFGDTTQMLYRNGIGIGYRFSEEVETVERSEEGKGGVVAGWRPAATS